VFILGTVIAMSLYRGKELSDRLSKMPALSIILYHDIECANNSRFLSLGAVNDLPKFFI